MKRQVIFTFINKKNRWVWNDMNDLGKDVPLYERHRTILKSIREYIKIGEQETKDYGEVFTPIELIDDMLNSLSEDVWENPNLKWLDPCAGIGTFPILVIKRLMDGLEKWQPVPELRYKHIVENMIYSCELQPKNAFTYLFMVDQFNENSVNLYCGSFLDDGFNYHMENVWGVDGFDIVLGNPPYNNSTDVKKTNGNILWDKFVLKSINQILVKNGKLLMVHPSLWRKPINNRSQIKETSLLMRNRQIHYLEIHDSKDGMKTFGAGTRYDWYLLENTPPYTETHINDQHRKDNKIDIRQYACIPNSDFDIFEKIMIKNDEINVENSNIIFNSAYHASLDHVANIPDDIFKYPIVHSTPKSGVRYKYSSVNNKGHFGIPKIIFGESGIYNTITDLNGEYGMSQGSMGIILDDTYTNVDIRNLVNRLESDEFKVFLKSIQWSNFRIDANIFRYIRKRFWESI